MMNAFIWEMVARAQAQSGGRSSLYMAGRMAEHTVTAGDGEAR